MSQNQATIVQASIANAAIRAVEGPVRRLGWFIRTSGVFECTSVRVVAAGALLAGMAYAVWLAASLVVAL